MTETTTLDVGNASWRMVITEWHPGQAPREVSPAVASASTGICLVDIDMSAFSLAGSGQRGPLAAALADQLAPLCGAQLEQGMVADLLEQCTPAGHRRYGQGEVRLAVSFEAEAPPDHATGATKAAQLFLRPVGLLVGNGWVVTCWHPRRPHTRLASTEQEATPSPHADLLDAVAARWRKGIAKSAGDLAVLILHELALTYAPAQRKIYSWLEDWELRLYSDVNGDAQPADRASLPRMWMAMTVLRDWLSPLNRSGIRIDIDKAWFGGCTDHDAVIKVDDRVDTALASLQGLSVQLRSAFGLLHVKLAEEQRVRTERLQHLIEYITAAVVVPALVVGFYGANTRLPGQETWWGFWVMVAAMAGLGGASLLALRIIRSRR